MIKSNNALAIYSLGINKFIITKSPAVISTVLGSCVSVCLYDPHRAIGGMNHYMLPYCFPEKKHDTLRFGDTAIPILIKMVKQAGGRQLKAKIFGGAKLFPKIANMSFPDDNISIARKILEKHGIEIVSENVGGFTGRSIHFYPQKGLVTVKKQVSPPENFMEKYAI